MQVFSVTLSNVSKKVTLDLLDFFLSKQSYGINLAIIYSRFTIRFNCLKENSGSTENFGFRGY